MSIDFVHSYSKTSGKSESDLSEVFCLCDRKFIRNYLSHKNLSEKSHSGGWI